MRKPLAGEMENGDPRAPYGARELLERLKGSEMRRALWAASTPPEDFEKARLEHNERHSQKPGTGPRQEQVMMQGLSIGLELNTSHHPSLLRTFPWIHKWIVRALSYVVELEDDLETTSKALAEEKARTAELEKRVIEAKRTEIELRSQLEARTTELAEVEGELRITIAERNAMGAAVKAVLFALQIAAQARPELVPLVKQLEDLKGD